MTGLRQRVLLFGAIALVGSQAGHLLAYQARFGGSALALQRAGAHQYFLPALTSVVGAVAAGGLAVLLVIAWSRVVAGRRLGFQAHAGWGAIDVLPPLFALQLGIYAGQETLEALAYGTPPPALLDLLLWGALGQVPVAVLGAFAVAWISTRLDGALAAVDIRLARVRQLLFAPLSTAAPPAAGNPADVLVCCAPVVFIKRGPPHSS